MRKKFGMRPLVERSDELEFGVGKKEIRSSKSEQPKRRGGSRVEVQLATALTGGPVVHRPSASLNLPGRCLGSSLQVAHHR